MAKRDRILVLDIGSTAIHAGEFDYLGSGAIVLRAFTNVEYTENLTETNRTMVINSALRRAMEEGKFTSKRCSICVSGQAAFMRFVKLPPVTEEASRVRQIVEYEARQNVPFPMEEVIWDYQLIGSDEEELEVMFAVIKNDIVDGVIRAVTDLDLQPELVDFAPAALYNAARANYVGEEECAMLLDIGGRCTNLLFLDGERFFARAIPIAGFTITQQIAKEFGISTDEAEILKRRHGFVALGGAYEEPESEVAATISKIIRNVMTRLHGEINRSINVYRTQQKGNKPTHLFLSGGSSTMAFTDHFFSEKLRMEVSYFNPFKIVTLGEDLDTQHLQEVAHMFPEVVGVALRNSVECPVEITLITDAINRAQVFKKRRPFILISCIVWILVLGVISMVNSHRAKLYRGEADRRENSYEQLKRNATLIGRGNDGRDSAIKRYETMEALLNRRMRWMEIYNAFQEAKPIDLWLDTIKPIDKPLQDPQTAAEEIPETTTMDPGMDPMGGGMFFVPEGGGTTGSTTTAAEFEWFDVQGHCVTIPETTERQGGEPVRNVFTPAQLQILLDRYRELREKDASSAESSEAFRAYEELIGVFNSGNKIISTTRPNLPQTFVEALRMSDVFSNQILETRLVGVSFDPKFSNLLKFRIQVRLVNPVSSEMP